jgi:hypothetical protein
VIGSTVSIVFFKEDLVVLDEQLSDLLAFLAHDEAQSLSIF